MDDLVLSAKLKGIVKYHDVGFFGIYFELNCFIEKSGEAPEMSGLGFIPSCGIKCRK